MSELIATLVIFGFLFLTAGMALIDMRRRL
jgi:hypothetical protein